MKTNKEFNCMNKVMILRKKFKLIQRLIMKKMIVSIHLNSKEMLNLILIMLKEKFL